MNNVGKDNNYELQASYKFLHVAMLYISSFAEIY